MTTTTTTQQSQTIKELKEQLKKATNEKEALSAYFLLQQQKDFDEYQREVKDKNFYLSNSFRNEIVKRWYNDHQKNGGFKLTVKASKAILGLAFLVEGYIKFECIPQNRNTIYIAYSVSHEEMNNRDINFLNKELNIEIQEHNKEEENNLEQEYLNSFIQGI